MKTLKKCAIVLALWTILAANSFGETFFGTAGGLYRLGDVYTDDDYGRSMTGSSFVLSFHHFSGTSPLGITTQLYFGNLYGGMEWNNSGDMRSLGYNDPDISDLRIFIAPSYNLRLGSMVKIPFALGPAFSLYTEQGYIGIKTATDIWEYKDTYYEALGLGLVGNGTLYFSPFSQRLKILNFMCGFSVEWDFLRLERGEMNMHYRETRSVGFNGVPYMSLGFTIFFGMGLSLD